MKVKDQWYIFYHRQTGCNEYSRQSMVEPVDIAMDKNGQIFIGKIRYDESGEPAGSDVVDCTSQGFNLGGLDAYSLISAGYTCHMYDGLGKPMYQDNAEGTNKDRRVAHVQPAIIDSEESVTRLNLVSKLCRNHTTTVAMRMTEKAFWRKSLAFSHMSWRVERKDGRIFARL